MCFSLWGCEVSDMTPWLNDIVELQCCVSFRWAAEWLSYTHIYQFSSITQSGLTLCNPMACSMPGFPTHHQHPELAQTNVHRVGDAIQPSHPLSSPSNESVLCIRWPKYWSFSLYIYKYTDIYIQLIYIYIYTGIYIQLIYINIYIYRYIYSSSDSFLL